MKHEWKNKNQNYLTEVEKLMDILDNIDDEVLKYRIVVQFLKCDNVLTMISEEQFEEYYNKGKKEKK